MKEEILLLPGANGTEMIRMMARFHKNTIGLRIMNTAEFARFALMRSGVILEENFLPRKQEAAVIDSFLRDISYFASAGYADAEKIADALYGLRSLIPEEESKNIHEILPQGEFADKNKSLAEVYDEYLKKLAETQNIDTIGLLRKALAQANPLTCSVYTLEEYPLTPLEKTLLKGLSADWKERNLQEFLGVSPAPLHNVDYTRSYGSSNEVAAIYDYILANQLPFDQCIVAVANPAQYSQLFYDFSQSHDLPITLGCGIPILNSNPARLLKLLYDWNNSGYHGVDALRAMLRSDALDRKKLLDVLGISEEPWLLDKIITVAGQLRLDFDPVENNKKIAALPKEAYDEAVYKGVEALSAALALGESKLIERFVLIREGTAARVDCSALSVICGALDAYAKYSGGQPLNMIIPQILQRSVCSENSREGALFVTGISGAMASLRKHLFVAGLSAGNFPGMPRENYLLLDSDFELLPEKDSAPTSIQIIQQKKATLEHLLALASALDVNIHLSYSCYNLADMKEENPSSVLFEIFQQHREQEATLENYKEAFKDVGYFHQQVSGDYTIGAAYVAGKEISYDAVDFSEMPCAYTKDREYSPSALDMFFSCPRRFFLTKILEVNEAKEDDPFTVISAAETGTLAHEVMEHLAKEPCDKGEFMLRAEAAFDGFLLSRPPIHPDLAAIEKCIFCKMMENAYDNDPHNEVLASEEKQTFRHSTGVALHGYPDRVERRPDGTCIIADYKTGRTIKHVKDDIDTCLQVVIYAYFMEQKGVPISGCEYRYLRDGVTVTCRYDADMKARLEAKLLSFRDALVTGQFPVAQKKEACTYCTLAGICGRDSKKEEAE